jgi:NADPH:quinone reductase-like Zn-dependent oxidoreductase
MRALRAHERGGPETLVYEEAPDPAPGTGDALVRVLAASFTPTELDWSSTWVDRAGKDRRPIIPSHEVSGIVTGLGFGTTGVAIGDAVYGLTDWYRDGAAAEYVAVEARNLAPKPPTLDHATAAAIPMAGLTAVQALLDHGRLASGQTALILGAGGGVGAFAVQVARAAGARVVAGARASARDRIADLGAHAFVDTEQDDLAGAARAADLVFDLVGGETLARARSGMRDDSVVVSVVEPLAASDGGRGPRAVFFVVEPNRGQLLELGRRITAAELRPVLGSVLPLGEGRAAFAAKQRGNSRGKSVLQVASD